MAGKDADKHIESAVIDLLRFPMIVLVVFIHSLSSDRLPVLNPDGTVVSVFRLVSEFISHNLAEIAVPFFFLVSGYFFFYERKKIDGAFYQTQLKKKFKSLLIPYFFWNLSYILLILLHFLITGTADEQFSKVSSTSFIRLITIDPIVYPLWFVRDLMVMVLISPLFYFLFKLLRTGAYFILLAFFFSGLGICFPGLSPSAITFFGLGSFFALDCRSLLETAGRYKILCFVLSAIFLISSTLSTGTEYHKYLLNLFIPFGIISSFNIARSLFRPESKYKIMFCLSRTVFFVYAVHTMYVINFVKGFLNGDDYYYFLVPAITIAVCIVLFMTMKKICPNFLSIIIGGRILPSKTVRV